MDEMRIVSKFTRSIISKLVRKTLKKKTGYDVGVQVNELNVAIADGKAHVHLNIDAELNKEELMKILKNIGLE